MSLPQIAPSTEQGWLQVDSKPIGQSAGHMGSDLPAHGSLASGAGAVASSTAPASPGPGSGAAPSTPGTCGLFIAAASGREPPGLCGAPVGVPMRFGVGAADVLPSSLQPMASS